MNEDRSNFIQILKYNSYFEFRYRSNNYGSGFTFAIGVHCRKLAILYKCKIQPL